MSKKIFSLLLSFTVFFSACSSKSSYVPEDRTTISAFFKNKKSTLYVFTDNKYTYLVDDSKNVKKLKKIFKTIRNLKKWSHQGRPSIYLYGSSKNKSARISFDVKVYASENDLTHEQLRKMGFQRTSKTSDIYLQFYRIKATYSRTTNKFKKMYPKKQFKKPIKFQRKYLGFDKATVEEVKNSEGDSVSVTDVSKLALVPLAPVMFAILIGVAVVAAPIKDITSLAKSTKKAK